MTPNFKKGLARLLQRTFWQDLIDVFQEEVLNLKDEMSKKILLYNAREIDNIEDLREINKSFGTFVDLTLLSDRTDDELLEYMRQETEGLIFKVQYKGTYEYFKYVFNRIYEKGETYLCFVDGAGIIQKGVDYSDTVATIGSHDFTQPFTEVKNIFPTFDNKVKTYTLDSTETANFDTGWNFDPVLIGQTINITKHMMIEFICHDLINKEGASELYLMTSEYFRYLERAINNRIQRKATTIPHIGAQITLFTDTTGSIHTIPDLSSICYVTGSYSESYETIKAGNATDGYYYERDLSFNESYTSDSTYNFINTWIPSRKIQYEVISTGNGSDTVFESDDPTSTIIQFPEITKKFLRIYWTHDGISYTAYDDGEGNIDADNNEATGTIDYTTGAYRIVFYDDEGTTSYAPDNGTDIKVSYYTKQNLLIDKVAIADGSGINVIEATFPTVEFNSIDNHFSVHFVIEKEES